MNAYTVTISSQNHATRKLSVIAQNAADAIAKSVLNTNCIGARIVAKPTIKPSK